MIRGPEGDEFRADGLLVALPALFAGRRPTDQSVAVGIAVDGVMVQLRATDSGIDVGRPDGRELNAVLTAEAPFVLGLAAGVLSFDDVAALVDIDGDESALERSSARPSPPSTSPGIPTKLSPKWTCG